MDNRTGEISGMATQAAGKVKENVGEATGSKELEAKGLAQEARARRNIIVQRDTGGSQRHARPHNPHVAAILILTVLIQVILVKSWT